MALTLPHPIISNLSYFQPAHDCWEADVHTEHYIKYCDGEEEYKG